MDNFQNTLYTGDNLYILEGLDSESVDLIYLDPPFNSKRVYEAPIGSKASGTKFNDIWKWKDVDELHLQEMFVEYPELVKYIQTIGTLHSESMMAYITFMAQRVIEMHRILKPTGSLYYHCDPTAGHFVKLMLDGIFDKNNFQNEVIWSYRKWTNSAKYFQRNHDDIYFYAKDVSQCYFEKQFEDTDYSKEVREQGYRKQSVRGEQYIIVFDKEKYEEALKQNEIDTTKYDKVIDRSDSLGTALNDVWDIGRVQGNSKERTGYPTQKPIALLDRIIKASCPEGGVVLDPFCGCATTCVSAQKLGRHWIGIDIEKKAVDLLIQRLSEGEVGIGKGMFNDFIATDIVPIRNDKKEEFNLWRKAQLEASDKKEKKIGDDRNEIIKYLAEKQNYEKIDGQEFFVCNGCKEKIPLKLCEIDHIIPRVKGGQNHVGNYQLLCANCNRIKGKKTMEQLKERLKEIENEKKFVWFSE